MHPKRARLGLGLVPVVLPLLLAGVAAAEPVRKIVCAGPEGSPWGDGIAAVARRITAESKGRVKVRAVPGAVAGDEVDTALACADGKLFIWAGSAGALSRLLPELGAMELPYLFEDDRQVAAALTGRPIALLGQGLERRGLQLVPQLSEVGWRSFAGPKPLRSPGDLRGLRVRSQESPIHLEMWRALGAQPKAISVLETLSALQAGIVQAFDQSPVYMFATSWYQHARVYTMSRHIYQPGVAVLCKGALAGLSAGDRRLVADVTAQELKATLGQVHALEHQVMAQLSQEGMQIVELTPEERSVLRRRTRPVIDGFRQSTTPLGREILDAFERATGARHERRP